MQTENRLVDTGRGERREGQTERVALKHTLLLLLLLLSRFSLTLCDPIDRNLQAPPSMGFSRQEHWSGLPVTMRKMDRQ